MKFKRVIALAMVLTTAIGLSGCSFTRNSSEDSNKAEKAVGESTLEDGGFYVLHKKTYSKLYARQMSFASDTEISEADNSRTLWYGKDWSKIPTMYEGDSLIYRYSDVLDEEFTVERFEDMGYTIGVCNLQETISGRYSVSTASEDLNIDSDSNTKSLYDLGATTVIIDGIGGAELRSGNIARGGTIIGLKKDKTYKTEVYVGTELKEYSFKADARALTSMEVYSITDYDFLKSHTLRINFPETFNSGYYFINGYGLVRYVKGTSYDENTDFNVPNEVPDDDSTSTEAKTTEELMAEGQNTEDTQKITIVNDKNVTVSVKVSDVPSDQPVGDTVPDPSIQIVGDSSVYSLSKESDNLYKTTVKLAAGDYQLTLDNLYGRTYNYSVE